MKFKALIKGKDSNKVRHLATRYATSAPMHIETKFYKEFTAPEDTDFELIIDSHTSDKFISVKTDTGKTILHNASTLR